MSAEPTWYDHAACKGKTKVMFTPQAGVHWRQRWAKARAFCDSCPVKDVCLAAALVEEYRLPSGFRFGMRGGETPLRRRRLRPGWRRADLAAHLEAELVAWPTKMERHGTQPCAECRGLFRPRRKGTMYCSQRCNNRHSSREGFRRRYQSNPEFKARIQDRRRAAYQANRERILAQKQAYYQANRERIVALARKARRDRAKKAAGEAA